MTGPRDASSALAVSSDGEKAAVLGEVVVELVRSTADTLLDQRTYNVGTDMSAIKTSRLNVRVAPEDDALLRQAADLLGESISEFLIESARERAERLVADRTRFALDEDEWSAFSEALDRPAKVKPPVRELFERSRPE